MTGGQGPENPCNCSEPLGGETNISNADDLELTVNLLFTWLNSGLFVIVHNCRLIYYQPTYGGLPILFRGCPAKLGHPMGLNF
jgi:hypothetical protein